MTIDFQKVADAIEKATPETKDLLFSPNVHNTIEEIAESNKIEEEKFPQMVDEIGYAILGLKNQSSFFDSLIALGFEKNTALVITKDVDTKIFSLLQKTTNVESKTILGGENEVDKITAKNIRGIRDQKSVEELLKSLSSQ